MSIFTAEKTFRRTEGLAPTYLCSLSESGSLFTIITLEKKSLDIPASKRKSGQRRFPYRAVNSWNNLDKDFKQFNTIKKKKLKMHMPEYYFYYRFL